MRYILSAIGLLAVLGAFASLLGGVMWNLADEMPIWWNGEDEE